MLFWGGIDARGGSHEPANAGWVPGSALTGWRHWAGAYPQSLVGLHEAAQPGQPSLALLAVQGILFFSLSDCCLVHATTLRAVTCSGSFSLIHTMGNLARCTHVIGI